VIRSPVALPPDLGSLLVVRLRSIGDTVLMLPLLAAIRHQRPGANLALLLEPPAASLLEGQALADRIFTVRPGTVSRVRTLGAVRAQHFEVALDLHGGPTAALFTRFSGAPLRVGLEGFRHRRAYNRRLPSPFKGRDRALTLHTVESNLAVARSLGLEPEPGLVPRLRPTDAGEAEADRALAAAGLAPGRGFVALHPGAALRSKTWPGERFAAVARALAADGLEVVVVTPPPGLDRPVTAAGPGRGAVRRLPPVTLATLLAVLARARLFIGNDSGPAHMAAAAGTPAVTVFGSQDVRVWRPYGPGHESLSAGLACQPCRGFTCANPKPFECLDAIGIDAVLDAARGLLARAT
jgi:ADP-heptose:LPS heptosyltransferase